MAAFGFASSAAMAGTPTGVAFGAHTPDPSVQGASVSLNATFFNFTAGSCDGDIVFEDVTGTTQTLCNAALPTVGSASSAPASCSTTALSAGSRSLRARYAPGLSPCPSSFSAIVSHTVTAATPVPTVTEWTLWAIAATLLLGGTAIIARRSRRTA